MDMDRFPLLAIVKAAGAGNLFGTVLNSFAQRFIWSYGHMPGHPVILLLMF
jgi:hypothetical protein